VPASLAAVAQQLAAPPAGTLAELAAVQPQKREAFDAGASGWVTWNADYTTALYTATTSNTAYIEPAWGSWNITYTVTSGNTLVYDANSNVAIPSGGSLTVTTPQGSYWNEQAQETGDQRAAREEREQQVQADWQRRYEEQERERQAVRDRALELLRSLLTDGQWASYQEKGWFEVRGKSGRRWRVRNRGQSGNIDLMPEIGEERDATYCAHPPGDLPDADAHAAQMLALVTDDEAFLRVANRYWRRPPGDDPGAIAQERVQARREPWVQEAA
jgi:hypothetical protein